MTEIAIIDATAEAFGHPSECTEPAPGTVVSAGSHGITVSAGGSTKEVATIAAADISVPSHAHDYTSEEGCHQNESHTLDPDNGEPSITINGSPVYLVEDGVTTDPTTGGNVDITTNPSTTEITKT
jgi:hypothetical protein